MPNDFPAAQLMPNAAGVDAPALDHGIVLRGDGVYLDPTLLGSVFMAAFDRVVQANQFFSELDYELLIKALYNLGPDFNRSTTGELMVRFAAGLKPFDPARRALYKAVKLNEGKAEYYFEPVYLSDPDDPNDQGQPAQLDFDEFVADMWTKGIRFGIDTKAVRAAIASGKSERVIVAQRLDAVPGVDAHIVEVSSDLHRSDAPRQLANGKLDLMAFQNRFPQINKDVKLLRKVPRAPGTPGYELSGIVIEPAVPQDIELGPMAGLGTVIEHTGDGEFLVSQQAGYLNVDSKSGQISVGDKIVSHDGVSSRTTGNLQLTGDYEEFGEVQEKRVIEGESITIHADVFGNIVSRGGLVLLNRNLVGGSAHNADGDIRVRGVASGAVVQTTKGEVHMERAESCVVSGTLVHIEHAINCEIIAEEAVIGRAEGCAVAARRINIDHAGPRRQSEMLVFALRPDSREIDEVIGLMSTRVDEFGALAAACKAHMEQLTAAPEVRKYVMLATKIRKKELVLTPEQQPQYQKLVLGVGPALKEIARVSAEAKAAETEQQAGQALVEQLMAQRSASEGVSSVSIGLVDGDTVVRTMKFTPDGTSVHDLAPKEIKARLRAKVPQGEVIFSDSDGVFEWSSAAAE
ncbi:MAG: flagellar assembly protein A [Massilia sp.]